MELRTEIKDAYTILRSDAKNITNVVAEDIRVKVKEGFANLQKNFIVDFSKCLGIEISAGNTLLEIHQFVYSEGGSIVFTELQDEVWQKMKQDQLHLSLNLSPTLIEAVDIISMEVLERDLLDEQA